MADKKSYIKHSLNTIGYPHGRKTLSIRAYQSKHRFKKTVKDTQINPRPYQFSPLMISKLGDYLSRITLFTCDKNLCYKFKKKSLLFYFFAESKHNSILNLFGAIQIIQLNQLALTFIQNSIQLNKNSSLIQFNY